MSLNSKYPDEGNAEKPHTLKSDVGGVAKPEVEVKDISEVNEGAVEKHEGK